MPSAPASSQIWAAVTGSGSTPPRASRSVATWSMLMQSLMRPSQSLADDVLQSLRSLRDNLDLRGTGDGRLDKSGCVCDNGLVVDPDLEVRRGESRKLLDAAARDDIDLRWNEDHLAVRRNLLPLHRNPAQHFLGERLNVQ